MNTSRASDRSGPLRFPRRWRIARRGEFQRVLDQGLRAGDARLTLWAVPNELDHPRLGLMVGRKHGNAVRRNRIKRVLREAFRLTWQQLPPGLDLACAPRAGCELDLESCRRSLSLLAERLARRLAER